MVERPRRRRTSYYIMPPNSFNHKEICSSFWIMFEVFHQSKANMLTLLCLLSEYRTIKRMKPYLIDRYQTCYINKVSLHVFSSHLILSLLFPLSSPTLFYRISSLFIYLINVITSHSVPSVSRRTLATLEPKSVIRRIHTFDKRETRLQGTLVHWNMKPKSKKRNQQNVNLNSTTLLCLKGNRCVT